MKHMTKLQLLLITAPLELALLSFFVLAKTTSSVKLREAPGKTAVVSRTLSKGERVEVLLRGEGWTLVKYKNQTGYVMSRYLQFP